ncbi:hypothetical protein GCM10008107_01050 [Psychrosphaera saromensis]|uniref:DUF3800 domain-containing protein n=1 Tax=Psychrosphaera saromensis TaxID=716813 RepID=A0A2S7UY54_9GAMM|nr:DUF3800 domain-containing protein [Psychrosphaera saromensis]PQJ54924.1 hypothetical protein BTO11_15535 [Psychrosphaera saromensis]GHB56075.1 hypothetical protein GCM10008107_01050 [Psychrosphaera saromensis]GLQ13827.1 hypothetical protein GCM10007917_12820 [Psychrosphaera saromensis]
MYIFIDESGSFTSKGASYGSWNVVAAYVVPEAEKRKIADCLNNLKVQSGYKFTEEVKLGKLKEADYFQFLENLACFNSILFATATDASLNSQEEVETHKLTQAKTIMANYPRMKFQGGKDAVTYQVDQITNLSNVLYMQLCCQIDLLHSIIERGIPFFIQRYPNSLKFFRWRVDEKNNDFEDLLQKLGLDLLQTWSIDKPMARLDWCDYRPMNKFMYEKGDLPQYLIDEFPELENAEGYDIKKIVRDDIQFVDSKAYEGVQVVDLLVSGVRRCLKGGFENNQKASDLLGSLMVQQKGNKSPINLISFGDESALDKLTAKNVSRMIHQCRKLMYKS